MLENKKVLVVGDTAVDIIVPYPKFLNQDRTNVEYPIPCLQGGGTAGNTAVALSKLGVLTEFLGTVGDDQYGQHVISDFIKEGVGTEKMIVDKKLHTIAVFAFIDESGERYLWGWPRVDQAFKEIDEKKVKCEDIKHASWVHSSGMALVHDTSSRYTIIRILKEAYEAGIPTSFDLNLRVNNGELDESYKEAVLEAIKYSNYVLGSGDEEFYYLNPQENWYESAKSFVTSDRIAIVRMGEDGSMAITLEDSITEGAFHVEVVDTVGAGDVYNAGFIAARLEGKSLKDSLIMGNAVSGYTVNHKGARSSPTKEDLTRFLDTYQ